MAAALMTLIQASLLQQENVGARGQESEKASPEGAKEPARAALRPVEPVVVKHKDSAPAELADTVARSLQQIMAAVTKLSDLDKTLDLAQQMMPAEDCEALKWHRTSLTAMEWTRNVQSEHVQALLKGLQSAVMAAQLAVPGAKANSTSGGACTQSLRPPPPCRPPGVFFTDENESSPGESEAKEQSDGSVVDELGEKENVPIGSLRNDLEKIRDRDPSCCLIVRNIKRLGLESSELLRQHFSRLGEVEEVCVAHSFEKPNAKRTKHRNGRIRPAALGFVVMASEEDAQAVLAAGSDQTVGQVCVNVRLIEPFDEKSTAGSP